MTVTHDNELTVTWSSKRCADHCSFLVTLAECYICIICYIYIIQLIRTHTLVVVAVHFIHSLLLLVAVTAILRCFSLLIADDSQCRQSLLLLVGASRQRLSLIGFAGRCCFQLLLLLFFVSGRCRWLPVGVSDSDHCSLWLLHSTSSVCPRWACYSYMKYDIVVFKNSLPDSFFLVYLRVFEFSCDEG